MAAFVLFMLLALAGSLARAAGLGTLLPAEWAAWRDPDGAWFGVALPVGGDAAGLAQALAVAVPPVVQMVGALQLGGMGWLSVSGADCVLTACPASIGGESGVIAALTSLEPTTVEVARELLRVAGKVPS